MPRGFDLSKKKLSEFEKRNRSRVKTTAKKPNYLRAALDLSSRPYQNQENIEYWKGVFRRTGEVAKENVKAVLKVLDKSGKPITSGGDFGDLSLQELTGATLAVATGKPASATTKFGHSTMKNVAVGKFSKLGEHVEKRVRSDSAFELGLDPELKKAFSKHGREIAKEAQRYPNEYWDMVRGVGYEPLPVGTIAQVEPPAGKFLRLNLPKEKVEKLPDVVKKHMDPIIASELDAKNKVQYQLKTPIPISQKQKLVFAEPQFRFDEATGKYETRHIDTIEEYMRHEFGHLSRADKIYPETGLSMQSQEIKNYIYEERPHEIMAYEAQANIPVNEAQKLSAEALDRQYAAAEARVASIKNTMGIQDDLVEMITTRALKNQPTEDIQGVVQTAIRELDKGLTKGRGRADELESMTFEMMRDISEQGGDIPFYIDNAEKLMLKPNPVYFNNVADDMMLKPDPIYINSSTDDMMIKLEARDIIKGKKTPNISDEERYFQLFEKYGDDIESHPEALAEAQEISKRIRSKDNVVSLNEIKSNQKNEKILNDVVERAKYGGQIPPNSDPSLESTVIWDYFNNEGVFAPEIKPPPTLKVVK
jgi:hypothetical protein